MFYANYLMVSALKLPPMVVMMLMDIDSIQRNMRGRPGLTTINTGVCVTSYDESDNALEYYGVIEDIIKIKWEGSIKLELVLFYCRWFDPTPNGLRRTEDLGLVEI